MKTRLTNNYDLFINTVMAALRKPHSKAMQFIFDGAPPFGSGHFSIQSVSESENNFLIVRQWRQDLGDRARLRIFNLDEIKYDEAHIGLTDDAWANLKVLMGSILVNPYEGIILDGGEFTLSIKNGDHFKTYYWKVPDQLGDQTLVLVDRLYTLCQGFLKPW